MPELPFAVLFVLLFLGALARGQGTYWLARLATGYGLRRWERGREERAERAARIRDWLEGESVGRGRRIIDRWGLLAVAGCYLTIGVQTIVIAAAGAMRMRWLPFALAQSVGALAWATIYSTIGFAAWEAVLLTALGRPEGAALLIAIVLAVAAWVLIARRRRSRAAAEASAQPAASRSGHDGPDGRDDARHGPAEPEDRP